MNDLENQLDQFSYLHKVARTAGNLLPEANHRLPWPQFLEDKGGDLSVSARLKIFVYKLCT